VILLRMDDISRVLGFLIALILLYRYPKKMRKSLHHDSIQKLNGYYFYRWVIKIYFYYDIGLDHLYIYWLDSFSDQNPLLYLFLNDRSCNHKIYLVYYYIQLFINLHDKTRKAITSWECICNFGIWGIKDVIDVMSWFWF
jgi:hypothetical protein